MHPDTDTRRRKAAEQTCPSIPEHSVISTGELHREYITNILYNHQEGSNYARIILSTRSARENTGKNGKRKFCIFKAHLIFIQPTVYGNTTINILLNKATATFNLLNKDVLAGFFASIYLGLNSRKHASTNHNSTPHCNMVELATTKCHSTCPSILPV